MENNRRWISYDWFKLITALILLIVFIVLMLRPAPVAVANLPDYPAASFDWKLGPDGKTLLDPQGNTMFALSADGLGWEPVIPDDLRASLPSGFKLVSGADGGWAIQDANGSLLYTWDLGSFTWVPAAVAVLAAATAPAATAPAATPTSQPVPTETQAPAPTPTVEPTAAPTEAPTVVPTTAHTAEPTTAPTVAPTAASPTSCQAPAAARLVVGQSATIRSNLNMRSEPLIGNNILQTNPTGMVLKVLDGPVCVPHQGSAYLWWQLETPDGKTGWSAEATLNGSFYFLEPVP
jgi:hypothetical protein